MAKQLIFSLISILLGDSLLRANPPVAAYIFPAGAQRGSNVNVRVGGLFLHKKCGFEILGPGVKAADSLQRTRTVWFEGSLLPLPDSQQAEDYPKDMAGRLEIAGTAPLGVRYWRLWTSQGATPAKKFIVGDLPEIVEDEIEGDPVPVSVTLPVTINGRIFPREDVDIWTVPARKGQTIHCEAASARLGSPLDARLEVRDPQGRTVAEAVGRNGADPQLAFAAVMDGDYQVRIHDVRFLGGQAFVYRLTLTADPHVERFYPLGGRRGSTTKLEVGGQGLPRSRVQAAIPANAPSDYLHALVVGGKRSNDLLLDVDDLPEHLEAEPNDAADQAKPIPLPGVFNGRIDKPGDVDCWSWSGRKGDTYQFELRAARLGSPVDGVLTIVDASGKELARAEGDVAKPDPILQYSVPADGTYWVRVQDRFRSRGGPEFAYRLRCARPGPSDFRLWLQTDAVTVLRKCQAKLKITVERLGGFKGPITLSVADLPAGVSVATTTLGPGQSALDLVFKVNDAAAIKMSRLTLRGSGKIDGMTITRAAQLVVPRGEPQLDTILLAVALPTPFQIKGEYVMGFAPRGMIHKRTYKIERGGYAGPIEVSLADRQARHLQGAAGPTIVVPAGVSQFTYAAFLPPWMETGRTCRVCVMGVGTVKEPDGSEHEVSFSSVNQNEQLVAVVGPGKLALEVERTALAAARGQTIALPVRIRRGQGLSGPVQVELVPPAHMRGVTGSMTIAAGQEQGELAVHCGPRLEGPFNMPVLVRATLIQEGQPVVAEARVDIAP
jgi:hypothetical protein